MKKNALVIGLLLAGAVSVANAEDANVSFKTGYDYSSGKYGSTTETKITSIPMTLNVEKGDWTFKASVPYVRIDGASDVIVGVGKTTSTSTTTRSVSGLGDLTTSATYSLYNDKTSKTGLDLTGKIKFGTASESKGLGTGQNDFWMMADGYKQIGNTTLLAGIGYGILGSSDTLRLNNVVSGNIGASYKLDDKSNVGAMFDARTKSVDTSEGMREMTLFYTHKLGSGYKLQAYAVKGFSDGSPNWGGGLNIGYNF